MAKKKRKEELISPENARCSVWSLTLFSCHIWKWDMEKQNEWPTKRPVVLLFSLPFCSCFNSSFSQRANFALKFFSLSPSEGLSYNRQAADTNCQIRWILDTHSLARIFQRKKGRLQLGKADQVLKINRGNIQSLDFARHISLEDRIFTLILIRAREFSGVWTGSGKRERERERVYRVRHVCSFPQTQIR